MTLEQFRQSLASAAPPPGLAVALHALWHDARGDWHSAHEAAQGDDSRAGAWVHAYLHRKEGDLPNAGYWYRQARRTPCTTPLDDEWGQIAAELLAASST